MVIAVAATAAVLTSVVLPALAVVASAGFVAGRKIVSGTQTRSLSTVGSAGCIPEQVLTKLLGELCSEGGSLHDLPCACSLSLRLTVDTSRCQQDFAQLYSQGSFYSKHLLAPEPRKCLCRGRRFKGLFNKTASNLDFDPATKM